jgi:hypothetical protein
MAVVSRNKNSLNKGWVSYKECFSTNHQKGMANYHVIESGMQKQKYLSEIIDLAKSYARIHTVPGMCIKVGRVTQGVARPITEMKYMYNPMSGNGE